MTKKLLIVGSAVVALLLIVVLGLSVFLDANQFRPTLEAEMTNALGRKVVLGNVRLSLLSGSISVEDVSIADDPAFGSAPFLTAKAVKVGVAFVPLVFSKSLRVQSFTLEEPRIVLLRSSTGPWNFSTLGTSSPARSGAASGSNESGSPLPSVSVEKLAIARGQIIVGSSAARTKSRLYQDVNIEATGLSYTSQFPFHLSAKTPGDGSVALEGKAGPLNARDAAATPLEASLRVAHLDVAATGVADPASGLGGVIDFTGSLVSDGREVHSKGTLSANKLQLVQGSSPARVPIQLIYESAYDLKSQTGSVTQGDVHVGKALARLTGTYKTDAESTTVRMKLTGRQMPVSELEASLPALGVTLPSGASLQSGTLEIDLAISGALDRLVTTGPISIANARLTSFDLGSKMAAVAALAGAPKSADTVIQACSAMVRVAPDGIRADNLLMIVPGVGSLTGNGTIAPRGAMNFKMVAKLNNSNAVAGAVSRVASLGHPENGTPFRIEGTTSNPVFAPDVSAAIGNLVNQPNAAKATSGFLQGLLGKKPREE
jgi:AsmA protein